ncbi:MAG: BRO family protein [Synergistales bacterium]|nr:BRO family protein [Synergistales bacterium]
METSLKVFEYGTRQVRTVEKDGEAWFVAKDVAEALGYKDTSDALKKHVDKEDKLTRRIADSGQMREVFIINEAGLYSLIFSSKLPSAKQFKHWVTHEVLPDIRKHGMYMSDKLRDAAQVDHVEAEGVRSVDYCFNISKCLLLRLALSFLAYKEKIFLLQATTQQNITGATFPPRPCIIISMTFNNNRGKNITK